MHIEFLKEYIELAQCLNFTEAARRSNITQSALSKHLVTLEKELGTQLVSRDRHNVELTQAGHVLLQDALSICEQWDRTCRRVKKTVESSALKIGGLLQNPRVLWAISSALAEDGHGDVNVTCSFNQTCTKPFIELLRSGEADLVFTYWGEKQEENNETEFINIPVFDDPFVAVLAEDHPLANRDSLSMEDLSGTPLIRLSGSYYSWGWDHIEAICARHGFNPQQRSVFLQPGLDYSLVNLEDDVLLLSQSALTGQLFVRSRAYRCIPLADKDACFSIRAVCRKNDRNATLTLFMSRIEKLELHGTAPTFQQ